MNSDLERLLGLEEELNEETGYLPHYLYEKTEEEYKSLKSKIEQELHKALECPESHKYDESVIESLKDTIEDFHRESKHSAEALSTLKQELQVKVLEIAESIRSGEYDEL